MKLTFLLIVILFLSCSSPRNISGLYKERQNNSEQHNQLLLNPNGTFEYHITKEDGTIVVATGIWKALSNKTISLSTHSKPQIPKTFYTGKTINRKSDKTTIVVNDYSKPISDAYIEVNNKIGKMTDEDGSAEFEISKTKTITVSFRDFFEVLKIENHKLNEIVITLRDPDRTLFTDEILQILNGKIKIPQGNMAFDDLILKKVAH